MSFKNILEEKNITGYRLAKETGIPQSTISDYVTEKKHFDSMKIGVAKKIADYLNISLDKLYEKAIS